MTRWRIALALGALLALGFSCTGREHFGDEGTAGFGGEDGNAGSGGSGGGNKGGSGGGDPGPGGAGGEGEGGAGGDPAGGAGGEGEGGSGGMGGAGGGGGAGGMGGAGGGGGTGGSGGGGDGTPCDTVSARSLCGKKSSIVRVLAKLPESAEPVSGKLKLHLRHLRLGEGHRGGYEHVPIGDIPSPYFDVSMNPGDEKTVWLDMCLGGEMWSEENCEFNLFLWFDLNDNDMPDAGEPTGRKIIDVSCWKPSQCHEIELDCTDGISCVSFDEEPICRCAARGCNSPIVICSE